MISEMADGTDSAMHDVDALVAELNSRMLADCQWLRRWRQVHRITAILLSVVLIAAPPAIAVGLVSADTETGKILLLAITIVGGISATFKPYTHSYRRRADMNSLFRLRDEFRAEIARSDLAGAGNAKVDVYKKYSSIYANIYELRGRELLEATLSVTEQREIAGQEGTRDRPNSASLDGHSPARQRQP